MKRRTISHKPGFTLVEMIIIISVIAILSAIGIVSYQHVRQNAYDAKAKNTLQQVETAFKAYITAGNKIPMRYYHPLKFYNDPGGGWMDLGVSVFHGGGIGNALNKAGFLSGNITDDLKNGPKKDTDLKNNIGFRQCGKDKVFFYIEIYGKGIEQREFSKKMEDLHCQQKTDEAWLAEHGINRYAGGWGSGNFRVQTNYLVAEIDLT